MNRNEINVTVSNSYMLISVALRIPVRLARLTLYYYFTLVRLFHRDFTVENNLHLKNIFVVISLWADSKSAKNNDWLIVHF